MATAMNVAATPHVGSIITPATLDTSLTAPTNTATVFTGGASGSRINLIRINQLASTAAAGILNLFLFDGTTYDLFDFYAFSIVTLSATSQLQPLEIPYQMLLIPASTWSLRCTVTVAAGQSAFKVTATGGDF